MKQRIYCLIVSLLLLLTIARSQSISETYSKAWKLFNDSIYDKAAEYFNRVAYFDTIGNIKDSAQYLEAQCYYNLHDYNEALRIDKNLFKTSKGKIKQVTFFNIIQCQFRLKQFSNVLTTLSLNTTEMDSLSKKKFIFYKSIAQLASAYYDDAQNNLMIYIGDTNNPTADTIKYLITKIKKQQASKISRVKYLSMIIPGSGQIVLGNFWNGLNSLLLNAALIAVTVNTSVAYTVYDGLITVFPWWFRYYQGGIRNAGTQADQKKGDSINKTIQDIIVLLDNYNMKL